MFFRDTAHGLTTWALATVLSASVLGAATTHITSGMVSGLGAAAGQAAENVSPADIYVDRLLRPETAAPSTAAPAQTTQPAGNVDATRSEVLRLWSASLRDGQDMSASDRTYRARVVAARTGIPQLDAEKRVNEIIVEAKAAADRARRVSAQLAFWMAASLLLRAFAASLAAVEGGQLRDGTWNGRALTPRSL